MNDEVKVRISGELRYCFSRVVEIPRSEAWRLEWDIDSARGRNMDELAIDLGARHGYFRGGDIHDFEILEAEQ